MEGREPQAFAVLTLDLAVLISSTVIIGLCNAAASANVSEAHAVLDTPVRALNLLPHERS